MLKNYELENWAKNILADPIYKSKKDFDSFPKKQGIVDARIMLQNSESFKNWKEGQNEYEDWYKLQSAYKDGVKSYLEEISYDKEIYDHFKLMSPILDVGGGIGTLREFLPKSAKYVSVDPFVDLVNHIPKEKKSAYTCLSRHINLIYSNAEFLPFVSNCFKSVHMRSMLDHVQIPDLAIIEAFRVLKPGGKLLVGLTIDGPPFDDYNSKVGKKYIKKRKIINFLQRVKILRETHDHHTWRPTAGNLRKILKDNGFEIIDELWQSHWMGSVLYVEAIKI